MKINTYKILGLLGAGLLSVLVSAQAQNAINVTLSISTSAGSTVTINPPSGSVTYCAANIYDSGTLWNQVRYPNSGERIPTGSLNGGANGTFPLTYAQNLSLQDSQGGGTTAKLSIGINIADIENGSSTRYEPNTGAGGSPAALMGSAWRIYRGGNSVTFILTGLAAGKEYDLYVYGSTTGDGQGCKFTLAPANVLGANPGNVTDSGGYSGNLFDAGFSALASQSITWDVLHAISDGSGTIVFNTSKNSSNSQYLNGFQLQPICEAATINLSPTNVTTAVGNSAAFSVSATGSGLTYQWRKNGVALTNSGSISGVNSNTLTINPVAIADIALNPGYDCLVGNAGGCSALSGAATLSVYSTALSAMPSAPANGATGVCVDSILKLAFNQPATLGNSGFIRVYDLANPNVPVDQIDLSQNVNGAQSRAIAGSSFNAYPVLISGNIATIFPNLNKLAANKTYFVTLDPGTFSDGSGALFTGITNTTTWRFTTRAAGPANSTNLIVAADGSGDFCTVQGALDYLPANNSHRTIINLRNGDYTEIVNVNNKHQLTFRGESRQQTLVGYPNNNTLNPGAPGRSAFVLNGNDCILETLTLTNKTPKGGGQAEAVDVEGTRAIFYNMNLASYQDTFLVHSSGKLVYFQDSLVQGDTDFMWGYGTVYVTNCEIRGLSSGAHVTQPRSPLGSNGFAFVNCTVTKGFASGTFDLGRTIGTPTSPSQSLFAQCLMDDAVTGYASDAGTNMVDYACSNLTATAEKTLAYSTHLSGGDSRAVAAQSASTWLYDWQPVVAPNLLSQPTNQTVNSGGSATFTVSATGIPAPAYQWLKNGTNLVGQSGASLIINNAQASDMGTYSVIVSNSSGTVTSSNATLSGIAVPSFLTPWSLFINTNNVKSITDYGANPGNADNATYIQSAINAAAAGGLTNGLRGGLVQIPTGTYLCGPLTMKSNVRLQLDAGAVLRLLNYNSYPGSPTSVAPFINASSQTNLAVTGLGMIDGQGSPWWPGYKTNSRPVILNFSACSKALFQEFTISNPPTAHIAVKGNGGNINFLGIKLLAPPSDDPVNPSHNTDGVDFAETNALFQNCFISTGDDNIAMGSSASVTKDILIANCFFSDGHGCAIGSYTSGGVSNITVTDCIFSNTDSGIRIKSQRDRGGLVQNLNYCNLTMTNVDTAVTIISYYEFGLGTLTTLTPQFVANYGFTNANPVPYKPPIFQNITVSNVTVSLSTAGRVPFLLLGLPDHPINNIVFKSMNLKANSVNNPQIYNATNVQFIDCSWTLPAADRIQFWNAAVTFTNSLPNANLLLLDGLTTNGIGNALSFYSAQASLKNTNALGNGPLTLGASSFTVSNNLTLFPSSVLNFTLGTNATKVAVVGNLSLGGTNNIFAGAGFTNGNYTLLTYTGTLSGSLPTLGATPPGYTCTLSTATAGQVNLVVAPPVNTTPTNLTFNVISNGNSLQLTWPFDHTGWHLESQTNSLNTGLGTNWVTVAGSSATNQMTFPFGLENGGVFFRLVYP